MNTTHDLVEASVREALAEAGNEDGLVVSEFIIIAATGGFDAEGNGVSQIVMIPSDTPMHRLQGLVENARTRLKGEVLGLGVDTE